MVATCSQPSLLLLVWCSYFISTSPETCDAGFKSWVWFLVSYFVHVIFVYLYILSSSFQGLRTHSMNEFLACAIKTWHGITLLAETDLYGWPVELVTLQCPELFFSLGFRCSVSFLLSPFVGRGCIDGDGSWAVIFKQLLWLKYFKQLLWFKYLSWM